MLAGDDNLVASAHKNLEWGPKFVVVKKGEHGALLLAREGEGERMAEGRLVCPLPGFPCPEVCDPTGAGDSFAGGLMGHLARIGKHDFASLRRAMAYGTVVASFTVEDFSLRRLERLRLGDRGSAAAIQRHASAGVEATRNSKTRQQVTTFSRRVLLTPADESRFFGTNLRDLFREGGRGAGILRNAD